MNKGHISNQQASIKTSKSHKKSEKEMPEIENSKVVISGQLGYYENLLNKGTHKIFIEIKRRTLKENSKAEIIYNPVENFKYFDIWLPIFIQRTEVDLHYDCNLSKETKKLILQSEEEDKPELTTDIKTEILQEIMISFDFFPKTWPIRFSTKFYRKYCQQQQDMKRLIASYVVAYSHGRFNLDAEPINQSTPQFVQFFTTKLAGGKELVWRVGIERLPFLGQKGQVVKYSYHHFIQFLDIVTDKDRKKLGISKIVSELLEHELRDPDRGDLSTELQIIETIEVKRKGQGKDIGPQLFIKEQTIGGATIFCLNPAAFDPKSSAAEPVRFRDRYIHTRESNNLTWDEDLGRWVPASEDDYQAQQKLNQYAASLNASLLQSVMDLQSAKRLVEILEKIPNFKIRMTPEEKNVVGQNGNVLALGRSGTGKTTCALLRLFATEILFKYKLTQAKMDQSELLRDTRFSAEDVDNTTGLHTVFVTASHILTNEVHRYYDKLTTQIKEELRKRRQKLIEKKQQEVSENQEIPMQDSKSKEEAVKLAEEQIQDINLVDEDLNDDDELRVLDQEEEAQSLDKYNILDNIEDKEFPLFLTVRKLILMIDGTLKKPFFARDMNHKIIQADSNAEWGVETNGVLLVNNYANNFYYQKDNDNYDDDFADEEETDEGLNYEDIEDLEEQYLREEQRKDQKRERLEAKARMGKAKKFCIEVDYSYFLTEFWPKYIKKHLGFPLSPNLVWSEITSNIKGGADSHNHPGFYLPMSRYLSQESSKKSLLTRENKEQIWDVFRAYEEWKTDQEAYDFQDVVNYILTQVKTWGYLGQPIHYLMIDEVQDLSHATILLLARVTEQGLFFAGDTAQTIANGVGFRFSDLAYLFNSNMSHYPHICKPPTIHQLTINFRSHAKILELANSVVNIIEVFFPKTIDRLKKEKSSLDGSKPIVLEDINIELLFLLLFGAENYRQQRLEVDKEKNPIEFGCSQVIIVRNQESKAKIPPLLKHALCLTVLEAKGLEFDDVILYNFFSDSISKSSWSLVKSLSIKEVELNQTEFDNLYFIYNDDKKESSEEEEDEEDGQAQKLPGPDNRGKDSPNLYGMNYHAETGLYKLKRIVNTARDFSGLQLITHAGLCNELKQLYVSITRPRKRLIIYDDDVTQREGILNYWKKLDLVETYSSAALQNFLTGNSQQDKIKDSSLKEDLRHIKTILTTSTKDEWRKQGIRMFNNRFYEQALKCFERCDDKGLYNRTKAYAIAERAKKMKGEIAAENLYLEEGLFEFKEMKANRKYQKKAELKSRSKQVLELFKEAGNIFLELGLTRQASQCFFSAEEYGTAAKMFEQAKLYKQAGEAYFRDKNYEKAAEIFAEARVYPRAIECYAQLRKYWKILDIIENFEEISPEDKKEYGNKFIPLALKDILNELETQEAQDQKKEESPGFEESSEEGIDGENETEIKELDEEECEESKHDESQSVSIIENKVPEKTVDELSFSLIEKSEQIQLKPEPSESQSSPFKEEVKKDIEEISFDKSLSKKQIDDISFSKLSSKDDDNSKIEGFDHLSQFESDNDWLKLDKESIIDAVSQLRRDDSKRYSDFSSIDYQYVMANKNCQLVKTKLDIFVQDSAMMKIIRVVSLFSAEAKAVLSKLPSKNALLSEQVQEITTEKKLPEIVDMIIDFDQIDLKFIYLILDVLEYYQVYKLCIFVCNRYKLAHRVGRYLVNIAHKFSHIATETSLGTFNRAFNRYQNQLHSEKALVANMAVHSILESINPKFLTLKKEGELADETNSLGFDCYREMILLGFWKKCLFIMDYKNSLALASSYASFTNYKLIYLQTHNMQNEISLLDKTDFEFLPFSSAPEKPEEIALACIALDAVIWDLTEKYPLIVNKFYRDMSRGKNFSSEIHVPKFPSYFAFNGIFWNFLLNRANLIEPNELLENYISSAVSNLRKILEDCNFQSSNIELRIYDLVNFIVSLMLYSSHVPAVGKTLLSLGMQTAAELVTVVTKLIKLFSNSNKLNKHSKVIYKALFHSFRVRTLEESELLESLGNSYVLCHISSPIFSKTGAKIDESRLYVCDIEYQFVLCEITTAVQLVQKGLLNSIEGFVNQKFNERLAKPTPLSSIVTDSITTQKKVYSRMRLLMMIEALQSTKKLVFNELDPALSKKHETLVAVIDNLVVYVPYISEQLLDTQIQNTAVNLCCYPKKDLTSEIFIRTFALLKAFQCGTCLTEIIRANKNHQTISAFSLLDDAFAYLKHGCTEEFCQNFFDFFSKKRSRLSERNQTFLLAKAASIIILSSNLHNGAKLYFSGLLVSACELLNQKHPNSKGTINLLTTLNPATNDDIIYELFYWLDLTTPQSEGRLCHFELLMNCILNIDPKKFTKETIELITRILKNHPLGPKTKAKLAGILDAHSSKSFEKLANDFHALSREEKNAWFNFSEKTNFKLTKIKVQSIEQIEANYENSERIWVTEQCEIYRRIFAQRKIARFYRRKSYKISDYVIRDPFINLIALRKVQSEENRVEMFYQFKRGNYIMESLRKDLMSTKYLQETILGYYFGEMIDNPIDCHYLVAYLGSISKKKSQLSGFFARITSGESIVEQYAKENIEAELNSLRVDFELWREHTKENDLEVQRMPARVMLEKRSQIAKKRAALKKNIMLKRKAEKIKMLGK